MHFGLSGIYRHLHIAILDNIQVINPSLLPSSLIPPIRQLPQVVHPFNPS